MSTLNELSESVKTARNELKNIRQEIHKMKKVYSSDVDDILSSLLTINPEEQPSQLIESECSQSPPIMEPIGYIESCFKSKNGVPRQASLCPRTRACLKINKSLFTNPEHSLQGLEEYSHLWILFLFHKNDTNKNVKAKVHPPRLNGSSIGVFASRSPHRPNPIGLSLCKVEKVDGASILLSGVDLLDGTPVLDIKPFIPSYDIPAALSNERSPDSETQSLETGNETTGINPRSICDSSTDADSVIEIEPKTETPTSCDTNILEPKIDITINRCTNFEDLSSTLGCYNNSDKIDCDSAQSPTETVLMKNTAPELEVKMATWISDPPVLNLQVGFTSRAEEDISHFHQEGVHEDKCEFCLHTFAGPEEVKLLITNLLENDSRSVYRRTKCKDRLYYLCIDALHITCWFDDDVSLVEVLKVQPLNCVKLL